MAGDRHNVVSVSDLMAQRLREIAEERQARIDAKLRDGYKPALDHRDRVMLVKREEGQGCR